MRALPQTSRLAVRFLVVLGLVAAGAVVFLPRVVSSSAEPVAPTDAHRSLTILWVGDTTPGSSWGLPPGDGAGLFAAVKARLRGADIAIGNLEGTLSEGGSSKCGAGPSNASGICFAFQAPARYAGGLRRAGFDVMNMANNHAMDFGRSVYWGTVRALRAHRLRRTGAPGLITIVQRNGTRVALIGFSAYHWTNPMTDLRRVRVLVHRAKRRADVVVVLMHAGGEGEGQTHVPHGSEIAFGENRGDTRAFAHTAVDAGADLVLGSGPHVVRGVERYHRRLIAYSLGNFASDGVFSSGSVASLSGMLEVRVDHDGHVLTGRWKSLRLVGRGTPVPDAAHASVRLVRELSRADFGAGAWPIGRDGRLRGLNAAP